MSAAALSQPSGLSLFGQLQSYKPIPQSGRP
jgi:hypothetical protein